LLDAAAAELLDAGEELDSGQGGHEEQEEAELGLHGVRSGLARARAV
jgi:hypothetical protein